jgi:hypothetical protein
VSIAVAVFKACPLRFIVPVLEWPLTTGFGLMVTDDNVVGVSVSVADLV